MHAPGALERLLESAKKRHLIGVAVAELALAASISLGGAVLLLIFGTQILNWYWPALLALAGFALAVWRIPKRLPSDYRLAQMIDRRLGLSDSVATAYHFSRSAAPVESELVPLQLEEAEKLAERADVRQAVPIAFPRSLYVCTGLLVIAGTLFAIRYGTMHTLALGAPIANIQFNPFAKPSPKSEAANSTKSVIQEKLEQQMQQLGIPFEQQNALTSDDPLAQKATSALATPDGTEPMESAEKGQATNGKPNPEGTEGIEGTDSGDSKSSSGKGSEAGEQEAAAGTPQNQQGKPQPNGKNSSNQSSENSLANKMRDAVSNLLSKLKPSKSDGQQQGANSQQGNSQNQQQASQKGMQGQSKSSADGQGNSDQQGDQDGDSADRAAAQMKPGDKNADKSGNQDSKSGVGKSDGSKDAHEAEQLAAMGKISEILGKRSSQVAGEMSVEVASGAQQLKTAYSQKKAQHSDTGAEIDRDEVPLMYQPYVRKYFEEVHKASKQAAKPASPSKAAATARPQQPVVQAEPSGH